MRRWVFSLVLVLACLTPAFAARGRVPVTLLLATSVDETVRRSMSPELWTRIVTDYANAAKVVPSTSATLPTLEACRNAGALYALLARFDAVPRLVAVARDPDRSYAVGRFTLLNCLSGATIEKTVQLESDPLSAASRGDYESNVSVTWERPVRERLARDPLALATVARIARVDGPFVTLSDAFDLTGGQVLRIFADANGRPRPAREIVVTEVFGKTAQATYDTSDSSVPPPRAGEYVEPVRGNAQLFTPAPKPTPSPARR